MGRKRKVPSPPHPAQEGMRRTFDDLRKFSESPLGRELRERVREPSKHADLQEQLRKASELPSVRKVGEMLSRLKADDEPPPASSRRKRGGGRPPILTAQQKADGRRIVCEHPDVKGEALCDQLREELRTNASNTVLWDHIIKPARQNSRT